MTDPFVQQVAHVLADLMLHERRYSAFALAPRVAAAIEAAAFGNLCHEREAALQALKGLTGLEKSGRAG
jgi:hypothetical protein